MTMIASLPVLVASSFALYLSLIDIREYRIPNRILLIGMLATTASMTLVSIEMIELPRLLRALLGGLISVAAFFLIHLVRPSGLGMGDVKFAGLIGMALAWISFPSGLIGLAIPFIASSLFAMVVFAFQGKALKRVIPFAPFMAFGLFFTTFGYLL